MMKHVDRLPFVGFHSGADANIPLYWNVKGVKSKGVNGVERAIGGSKLGQRSAFEFLTAVAADHMGDAGRDERRRLIARFMAHIEEAPDTALFVTDGVRHALAAIIEQHLYECRDQFSYLRTEFVHARDGGLNTPEFIPRVAQAETSPKPKRRKAPAKIAATIIPSEKKAA